MGIDSTEDQSPALMALRRQADEIGRQNRDRTDLASIYGGGQSRSPKLALVFINPTQRNISSQPGWIGPRFPFIGTPRVWRLLGDCHLLNKRVAKQFSKLAAAWSVEDARELERQLVRASLYITNVVKETAPDSLMPPAAVFRQYEALLHDEMALVKPRLIIAFGLTTHKSLTGVSIKLGEIYAQSLKDDSITPLGACRSRPVVPCYFPVGRGNPQRAAMLLQMVAEGKIKMPPQLSTLN